MNQRGFATLEVIMMVVVIGILATIAVPRFTDITTKANTAKIQADLTTIDTAIQMYNMETGQDPSSLDDLKDYLMETPEPPTGSVFVKDNDKAQSIPDNSKYDLNEDKTRAVLTINSKKLTVGDFGLSKSTTTTNGT